MLSDIRVYLLLAVMGSGVIFGIFQAPPLTTRETDATSLVQQSSFETVFEGERDHCEDQPGSYDCRCYGRISGVVQSGAEIKVTGAERIDRQRLGRMQASDSC